MSAEVYVAETQVQGFHALTLANQVLSLTIIPDLGGKISSIRDRRTDREWLWTNPGLPYQQQDYGTSYVQKADSGGWDECFPTVAACSYPAEPWQGLPMPDHGEIWSQPWTVQVEGNPATTITLSSEVQGVRLPYVFQRRISIHPDSPLLRFDYSVKNLADSAVRFIWSAHPLFAVEPGMQIRLPKETAMRVWSRFPSGFLSEKEEYPWPIQTRANGKMLNLNAMPDIATGIACKLWSQPLSQGYAVLGTEKEEFCFTFDPAFLQIGLWVNAHGWSGTGEKPYYNLALEPCIGAQDSLEEAVGQYGQYRTLSAHGTETWWLEVHLNMK